MKTKKIAVYLKPTAKYKLNEISYKYQVSISTIADVLSIEILKNRNKMDKEELTKLFNEYIYTKQDKKRTTIKLSTTKNLLVSQKTNNELSIIMSNILNLYGENKLKKLIKDNNFHANIGNTLRNSEDIYWNLNQQIRVQKRAQRILNKGN